MSADLPVVGSVYIADSDDDELKTIKVVGLMESPQGPVVMITSRSEFGEVFAVDLTWLHAFYSLLLPGPEPDEPEFETSLKDLAR